MSAGSVAGLKLAPKVFVKSPVPVPVPWHDVKTALPVNAEPPAQPIMSLAPLEVCCV